ncbi:MAG: beta-galactosidase small subunit, partial [Bacteroidota bacterium]
IMTSHKGIWEQIGAAEMAFKVKNYSIDPSDESAVKLDVKGVLASKSMKYPVRLAYVIHGDGSIETDYEISAARFFQPLSKGLFWGGIIGTLLFGFLSYLILKRVKSIGLKIIGALVPIIFFIASLGALGYSLYDYNQMKPLPRIGVEFELPKNQDQARWYGKGPLENYPDRNQGYKMGVHQMSVQELHVPYVRPQENGNRTQVRWLELGQDDGAKLRIEGDDLNFSAHYYSYENLASAAHTVDLKAAETITLNVDHKTSGLGGCSFMYNFMDEYLLTDKSYAYRFTIKGM